uniref:Protein-glutamine gamma-glutamyltransferase 2 n=1 Tax=Periophthalmus magnuspinnatus TaxID=409849 RepID=A0A3B4AE55_9GOBI
KTKLEIILGVDFKPAQNNPLHHTGVLSRTLLIVRRGQSFSMQIQFNHPFISGIHNLVFTVTTADWVYMPEEDDRQEYVMNTHGIIYKGSGNYITSMNWDYGQFEEKMVQICLTLLDLSHKHLKDPADDVSARCNPIYVSRIISSMINSEDDRGVLQGRWGDNFVGGTAPTHWSGSYTILQRWLTIDCYPVKFGQCWVFAGVMCSVMRFFGIPCRVVTNYQSAHDNNKNLIVDVYHPDYGVRDMPSKDSVWNYHVWVEGWMKRPDLRPGFDGWQVLDPTPQEKSEGIYWCGPAPVTAILNGNTDLKYDVPFVFAEVNADCIDWLVGKSLKLGQNISTKSVGSDKRWNITSDYKKKEGQAYFYQDMKYIKGASSDQGLHHPHLRQNTPTTSTYSLFLSVFQVSKPLNGEDVKVNLVLHSDASVSRPLTISITVTAMSYNATPLSIILCELKKETLLPGKGTTDHEEEWCSRSSNSSSSGGGSGGSPLMTVQFKLKEEIITYTVCVQLLTSARVYREVLLEVSFWNPVNETLKECTLTLSGSGLWTEEQNFRSAPLCTKTLTKASEFLSIFFLNGSIFHKIDSARIVPVKDSIFYRF